MAERVKSRWAGHTVVLTEDQCNCVLGLTGWPWPICRLPKGHYGQRFTEVHDGETGTASVKWRDEDGPTYSVYVAPGVYHYDDEGHLQQGPGDDGGPDAGPEVDD